MRVAGKASKKKEKKKRPPGRVQLPAIPEKNPRCINGFGAEPARGGTPNPPDRATDAHRAGLHFYLSATPLRPPRKGRSEHWTVVSGKSPPAASRESRACLACTGESIESQAGNGVTWVLVPLRENYSAQSFAAKKEGGIGDGGILINIRLTRNIRPPAFPSPPSAVFRKPSQLTHRPHYPSPPRTPYTPFSYAPAPPPEFVTQYFTFVVEHRNFMFRTCISPFFFQ